MYQTDFEPFSALLRQHSQIYSKKLTDEMVQGYWSALKDQPWGVVRKFAEEHLKHAKFFPKPSELRPKEDTSAKFQRDEASLATFREGEARCIRNLDELRRNNPEEWSRQVVLRKLERLVSVTYEGDPAYPRILCEWRQARGIHVGEKEWVAVGGR